MAVLMRGAYKIGEEWMSLAPVVTPGTDATEYDFSLASTASTGALPTRFSVKNWQMEHLDAWYLARVCSQAHILMDAMIAADVWRNGRPSKAYMFASISWLELVLCGVPGQKHVSIAIYSKIDNEADTFLRSHIKAKVDDVCRFGLDLEREIIAAAPLWAAENGYT